MSRSNRDALEGARRIRHYLPQLLKDPSKAARLDQQLADLLARARQGEKVDNAILVLIAKEPDTREWMDRFLNPDEAIKGTTRGGGSLPGQPGAVGMDRFACPGGDYVWCRHSVGEEPPVCPTHALALVRDGQC